MSKNKNKKTLILLCCECGKKWKEEFTLEQVEDTKTLLKNNSYFCEDCEPDPHLGCYSYPNCDIDPNGCRFQNSDEDIEPYGHRD